MSRMPAVHTLLLDAGGVLLLPNWDRVADTCGRHGVEVSGDALRGAEPVVKFRIDQGMGVAVSADATRSVDYLEGVLDGAGVAGSKARTEAVTELLRYHADHNLWEFVPDDVIPALEGLRALELKLAVASNANGSLHRCLDRLGLTPYFDVICDSFVEGVEKPDPRFFEAVLGRTGSVPGGALHVGDLYHVDVVGARSAGLRALLLDRDGLYAGFEVDRVRNLSELVAWLA